MDGAGDGLVRIRMEFKRENYRKKLDSSNSEQQIRYQ